LYGKQLKVSVLFTFIFRGTIFEVKIVFFLAAAGYIPEIPQARRIKFCIACVSALESIRRFEMSEHVENDVAGGTLNYSLLICVANVEIDLKGI